MVTWFNFYDMTVEHKGPVWPKRFTDSLLLVNCKGFRRKNKDSPVFLASTHLPLRAVSEPITHLLSGARHCSRNEQITRFLWEWAEPVAAHGFQHTSRDWLCDLHELKTWLKLYLCFFKLVSLSWRRPAQCRRDSSCCSMIIKRHDAGKRSAW